MAAKQQIPEVQGVQDSKVRDILTTMRTIINNITGRNSAPINKLSATADLGGTINKVNEILAALQDMPNTQSDIPIARGVPCFSAWQSATQSGLSSIASTKVNIDTEEFDLTSAFDTNNGRFNPQVAGYYQVNGTIRGAASTTLTNLACELWKNGVIAHRGSELDAPGGQGTSPSQTVLSTLIYLNGTTDYIELYGFIGGTGTLSFTATGQPYTGRFSAYWIRNP